MITPVPNVLESVVRRPLAMAARENEEEKSHALASFPGAISFTMQLQSGILHGGTSAWLISQYKG